MENALENLDLPFQFSTKIPGFVAFTSTRRGGVSIGPYESLNLGLHVEDQAETVRRNREILWQRQELHGQAGVCLEQVHGTDIRKVDLSHAGAGWQRYEECLPACDGAITDARGLMLTIGMADCLALVVVDPAKEVVGVGHAGWRGALGRIATKLVSAMKENYGCQAEELFAGLSVCLGPCCLELGSAQYEAFSHEFGRQRDEFCGALKAGHFKLDLWNCCKLQLLQSGLPEKNISVQAQCTACHPELFYSYRRDKQKTGRMWLVAGFKK